MKSIICLLSVFIVFTACDNNTKENEKKNDTTVNDTPELSLEGNWEMVGYYNYRNNEIVDSFKTSEGYRQVKMFNKNKVMWSKLVPTDSIEWFGYGSYKATDSTLTEQMQYGSEIMNTIIAEQKEFNYKLVLKENSFSQIRVDEDGYNMYSENYKRID